MAGFSRYRAGHCICDWYRFTSSNGKAHLGGEKEEAKASGAGDTWGDLDEFPSDAGCWDETVKSKKAREHGQQKSVGHCNEKKKVLVLHLRPDFGLKRCKELKTAGGEESC